MYKISCIIPVYNQEELVIKALKSIPSRKDIEIIIIDDGSTDKTWENINKYIKETDTLCHICLLRNKINKGLGFTANRGLDRATGEYIMRLDSDDYIIDLECVIPYLDGTDMVYYNLRTNNGNIIRLNEKTKDTYVGQTKFMRREFIGDLRYPEVRQTEDKPFYFELKKKNPSEKFTNLTVVHYNFPREGSIQWNISHKIFTYKNIYYVNDISSIGGVETFLYELAKKYKNYDITIFYKTGNFNQIQRLRKYVNVEKYTGQRIKCEKAFFGFGVDILDKIEAKEKNMVLHGDYEYFLNTKIVKKIPIYTNDMNYYGVSKLVCDKWKKVSGLEAKLCYNPITVEKPKRILKLISATRLTKEKGYDRMVKLAEELDKSGIDWQWTIFTNDSRRIANKNIIYREPRLDIRNYIADNDYLVQLSDTEAFSYSIIEALMLGAKVIVTNMEVIKEIGVKDGVNGFVLDFDLSNLNIKKIYDKIDMKFEYTAPKDNWSKLLAKGKPKERNNNMWKLEVLQTIDYSNFDKLIDIKRFGKDIKGKIIKGDIIVVSSKEEADYLCGNNSERLIACKILGELETATKPKKTLETAVKKQVKINEKKVTRKRKSTKDNK